MPKFTDFYVLSFPTGDFIAHTLKLKKKKRFRMTRKTHIFAF